MRFTLAASFALGLGSLAFAGPGVDKRAAYIHAETRDSSSATARLLREARTLLAPLVGTSRVAPRLELVSDRARFDALARAAGQPDATVFCDFERQTLVALDLEVDAARARVVVHEAARLHVAAALGARPAPWLEEGLACCAEDAWVQRVELGSEHADSDRAARARFELRGGASLERLVALPAAAFERGERVHKDVALAWLSARHLVQADRRDGGARLLRALGGPVPARELGRALAGYAR